MYRLSNCDSCALRYTFVGPDKLCPKQQAERIQAHMSDLARALSTIVTSDAPEGDESSPLNPTMVGFLRGAVLAYHEGIYGGLLVEKSSAEVGAINCPANGNPDALRSDVPTVEAHQVDERVFEILDKN